MLARIVAIPEEKGIDLDFLVLKEMSINLEPPENHDLELIENKQIDNHDASSPAITAGVVGAIKMPCVAITITTTRSPIELPISQSLGRDRQKWPRSRMR